MAEPSRVALVVVSHSRSLAHAAIELAGQMLHDRRVDIDVAAGLDDTTFGTDAVRIKQAIERVDGPAGVVVLMDLGSAVLSAELALDLLEDPSARERVVLSPAPIVEGLVVAAVAAACGLGRHAVAAEAAGALLGKTAQLADPAEHPADHAAQVDATEVVGVFTVTNRHGLHARPAARLVGAVRQLDASIELRNLTTGAGPVPAGSLSRVATLGALHDHEIELRASGPQAGAAVEQLIALAGRSFDEQQPTEDPAGTRPPHMVPALTGPLPASAGIAIGPIRTLAVVPVDPGTVEKMSGGRDPAAQWGRIVEAVAHVRGDIERVRDAALRDVSAAEGAIFDAHLALLTDPELLADVKTRIGAGDDATSAWSSCLSDVEGQWAHLPDSYLRERAADVRAVADQVRARLTGTTGRQPTGEGILVAPDLTPADVAGLDTALVSGVVLAYGSPSSHAAILARARGLPMVVAAGAEVLGVAEGTAAVLDGGSGHLHLDPATDVQEHFAQRAREQVERRQRNLALAEQPTVTRDGVRVDVAANLSSAADARAAVAAGADAAGLVRTEFLFLGRGTAPDLTEQEQQYGAIAEAMGGRRITLRTLDGGGDKPLPYLDLPLEQNPFLGLRGIRLSLQRCELLREQLTAVCRTARRVPISVLFPMVSTLDELLHARRILVEAAGVRGVPAELRVGIMVEVPSAALKIESFLPHVDFVSIGTNDLTQYTLAAERGNATVAALSDALDPAVLQLIARVCRAARGRADVAVCGEAAADEVAIPVLVGLGVRELSVAPTAVPGVKATIRNLDSERCRALAEQALTLAGADDVRHLVLAMSVERPPDRGTAARGS